MHSCPIVPVSSAAQTNRQGPDVGTQYRSAIFTLSDEQAEIAKKVMQEVQEAYYPDKKIATTIEPAGKWWDAEDYHQECAFSPLLSRDFCSDECADTLLSHVNFARPPSQPERLRVPFGTFS